MARWQTLALIFAALLAYVTFAWWQQDDFYIHLQYARHVLHDAEWSFNKGTPAYGSTSPLWVILVAFAGVSGLDLPLAAKMLSIGFAVLAVVYLLLNLSVFRHRSVGLLCIVSLIANHWIRLAAGSGMEATLAGFLALVLGIQVLKVPAPSWRHALYWGLLTGVLILSRPEWFCLPFFFFMAGRTAWRVAPAYLLGLLIILSPWFGFAWHTFGTGMPNTVAIKSLMISPSAPLFDSCMTSAVRLLFFYLPTNSLEVVGILFLAGLVLADHVKRSSAAGGQYGVRRNAPMMAWGLVLLIPAIYFVNQARGGESISYRYGAPALPMLLVMGWLGVEEAYERLKGATSRRLLLVFVAIVVCSTNIMLSWAHLPFLRRSVQYVEVVLAGYGKWLKVNSSPGSVVACYDVGAIAYYSDRRVLDLIGLNSMEVIGPNRKDFQNVVNEYALRRFRPDYLVTRLQARLEDYDGVLPKHDVLLSHSVPSYRFEPLKLFDKPEYARIYLFRLYWPETGVP